MLTFLQSDLCAAFGIGPRAASMWCEGLPNTRDRRNRRYNVADFLPTLSGRYAPAVPAFIAMCHDDGGMLCATAADYDRARALDGWLTLHIPGAGARLWAIRQRFFDGLAGSFKSSGLMDQTEFLRLILPRSGPVLRYLVTGDEGALPADWHTHCRQFALVHAGRPTMAELAA